MFSGGFIKKLGVTHILIVVFSFPSCRSRIHFELACIIYSICNSSISIFVA